MKQPFYKKLDQLRFFKMNFEVGVVSKAPFLKKNHKMRDEASRGFYVF